MNLFKPSKELIEKIEAYETHIQNLETDLTNQNQRLEELASTVESLTVQLTEKEEVIDSKEQLVLNLEETVEEKTEEIETKDEVIKQVIENTVSVEKQAANKAAVILAEMGVESAVETVDGPKEVDLIKELQSMDIKELIEYYNKNKPTFTK